MASLGDNIAGYTLLRRIGRGGMGEIFVGRHRVLGRLVAIKVLLPEVLGVQALVDRFLDEARAAAAIQVEAIAEVFDCGYLVDGRVYIVMELLQGANLRDALRMEPSMRTDLRFAAAIVGEIAQGLHAGHVRNIVHRDVKPENIFLSLKYSSSETFRVKILDYGIAKLMSPEHFGTLTRTGGVLGTPRYMSPEQCRGERDIDPRSDVYSLGCVAFELLSGRAMFQSDTIGGLLIAQATEVPPPLQQVTVGVPAVLARLIDRMLDKDRQRRPQSMAEVVATIALFLGCEPGSFARYLRTPDRFLDQRMDVCEAQDRVSSIPGVLPELTSSIRTIDDGGRGDDREDLTRKSYRSLSFSVPDLALSHADPRSSTGIERPVPPFPSAGRLHAKWWPAMVVTVLLGALVGLLLRRSSQDSPPVGSTDAPAEAVVADVARVQPALSIAGDDAVALVELTSEPAGAEVWLPNEVKPRGQTPLSFHLPLAALPLLATLRAEGYETHTVELRRFERFAMSAELHALPARRSRGTRQAEPRTASRAGSAEPAPAAPVASAKDAARVEAASVSQAHGVERVVRANGLTAAEIGDGASIPDPAAPAYSVSEGRREDSSDEDPYNKVSASSGAAAVGDMPLRADPYEKVDVDQGEDDPYVAAPDAVETKFSYHKASD